jgi:hypothetical protein
MNPNELESLSKWRESGKEELSAQLAPQTLNRAERTVDVVWFTGTDVPRHSWVDGPYLLKFDPRGADLSLLNNGAPVLDNHWSSGASDQKGRVERAWTENGLYKATLRFSQRPEVDGLWRDIADGIVTKFSMGVEIIEMTDHRDTDGKLKVRTARKWRPFELSIAPIPADFGTTTLAAAKACRLSPQVAYAIRVREIEILRLL